MNYIPCVTAPSYRCPVALSNARVPVYFSSDIMFTREPGHGIGLLYKLYINIVGVFLRGVKYM